MPSQAKSSGFTLIEVMITVAIVAILAAVALPSYRNYTVRGKIPEATSLLGAQRVKMEQFYQDNRTYAAGPASATGKYFDVTGSNLTDKTYTLTATGKGTMAGFVYTVDQANTRTTTVTGVKGWASNGSCWVTNVGGQC